MKITLLFPFLRWTPVGLVQIKEQLLDSEELLVLGICQVDPCGGNTVPHTTLVSASSQRDDPSNLCDAVYHLLRRALVRLSQCTYFVAPDKPR